MKEKFGGHHEMETTGGRDRIDRSGRVDSYFNIPKKVIDISKMSPSERRSLTIRLRSDLARTRSILNLFQLRHANTANRAASSLPTSGSGKKQGAPGPSSSRVKCGDKRRFESYNGVAPPVPVSNPEAMLMKKCEKLLKSLMSHKHAWLFNDPVDVVKFKIPDYYDIIKYPMDLGTIKTKFDSGAYKNPWDFAADVRLTFTNAMRYNPPCNNVHVMADTMRKFFEARWKPIQKKLSAAVPHFKRETEAAEPPVDHNIVVIEEKNQKMTKEEKQNLHNRLMSLAGNLPRDVDKLLWQCSEAENQKDKERKIDISPLRDDTLFGFQKILDKNMLGMQKSQQVMNVSGLKNPSTNPSRSNESCEENVDICDNSPLIPSSPVFIKKDAKQRNDNNSSSSSSSCSSSSSSSCSSSDSDSSSTDSDSESSSGSESCERVASPMKTSKENIVTELALNQEKSDVITVAANILMPLDKLDSPEQDTHSKPAPVGTNVHAEGENANSERQTSQEQLPMDNLGENANSERQVSQEQLCREALLKRRFADTILKAREKTINMGARGAPENLQYEREELERQQKEEKARLIAEAKAAEEAEFKRQLELQRKAAREALEKIKKTVEFNDSHNTYVEILRTGTVQNSTSSVEDYTAGFRIGGDRPLEQLGLFLKVDDDEEEEEDN